MKYISRYHIRRFASVLFTSMISLMHIVIFKMENVKFRNVRCSGWSNISVYPGAKIILNKCTLNSHSYYSNRLPCGRNSILALSPSAKIVISHGAIINGAVICARSKMIKIGKNVHIADGARIFDSNFHSLDSAARKASGEDNADFKSDRSIVISDDVWIGSNVTILRGSKIGKGAIIGANCTLNSHTNIEPFAVIKAGTVLS